MQAEKELELLSRVPTGLFINGEWRDAAEGATLGVYDPATEEELTTIADAEVEDGLEALQAASDAFSAWAATPPRERAEILRRTYDLVMEHIDDFELLMTIEMGKPLPEARGEVLYGAEFLRWYSEEAVRITGRYGSNPEGTGRAIVTKHPVGPAYLITPWNFPLAMGTRKIAPALAAGCTVVVKPAALTPLTTNYLAKMFEMAGLPKGVINIVTTTRSREVSAEIIDSPLLRKLSFTGSTPVGQALLRQAASGVLRTSMELGGNAPFIVFEDADMDAAVEGALQAKFRNIGQACTAANRFIVARPVVDEFMQRVTDAVKEMKVGRGTEPGVRIGPLIDSNAVNKSLELILDATKRGANLTTGGAAVDGPGSFLQPTVIGNVPADAEIMREEIFGPVLAVIPFDTEEEAVSLANSTEYGLVSYAFTEDMSRAQRLIESVHTGMMGINVGVVSNASQPFGGWKMSGLGSEGGPEGIEEYLQTKYTLTPDPFAKK